MKFRFQSRERGWIGVGSFAVVMGDIWEFVTGQRAFRSGISTFKMDTGTG